MCPFGNYEKKVKQVKNLLFIIDYFLFGESRFSNSRL